jgi:hypothetical protein
MRTPVSDFDFGEGDGNDGSDEDILEDVGKPTPARRKPETTVRLAKQLMLSV